MDMCDTNDDGTVDCDEGKAAAEWVKNNLATMTWEQVEEAWTAWKDGWKGPTDGECTETTAAQECEEGEDCGCDWESKAEEWFRGAQEWAKNATDEDWAGAWDKAVEVWDHVDTSDNGKVELEEATGAAEKHGLPAEAAEFLHEMMDTNDDGTVDGEEGKAAAMWLKDNLATITWEEVRTHWGAWKMGWKGPGSECEGGDERPTREEVKDWVKGAHAHLKGMIEEGRAHGMTTDDMAGWVMDHVDTDDSGAICLDEGSALGEHFGLSRDDVAIIGELMDADGSGDVCQDEVADAIEAIEDADEADLDWIVDHYMTESAPEEETTAAQQKHSREDVEDWVKGAHKHLKGMIEEGRADGMTTEDMADWVMGHVDTNKSGDICLEEGKALGEEFGLDEEDVKILGGLMDTDGSGKVEHSEVVKAIETIEGATDDCLGKLVDHYMEETTPEATQ